MTNELKKIRILVTKTTTINITFQNPKEYNSSNIVINNNISTMVPPSIYCILVSHVSSPKDFTRIIYLNS